MRFGKYEVEGKIGQGAMGVVYRAVDPSIGRRVAVKTLKLSGDDSDVDLKERFYREAKAAGVLNHRNIVTVHDVDLQTDGTPYIVMEYLDGVNLGEVIRTSGAVAPDQAVTWVHQVAEALDHAHQRGIVHRDVKPANAMLTSSGEVKITDFGIAKLETADQLTQVGHFVGTPNYIAPEQLMGERVDGRADLFSLAVMAYELLSGQRPFVGKNFNTLSYQILNAEPPPVEGLSEATMKVLTRGMAKSPDERYASGHAFVADLASTLGLALPSRSPSGAVPSPPATVVESTMPTVPDAPASREKTRLDRRPAPTNRRIRSSPGSWPSRPRR